MSKKKTTMQDIADALGISKVSVSKAINDQAGVSEELRRTILEKAQEMAYTLGQRRRKQKNLRFAFIITKAFFIETDTFYSAIYYAAHQYCGKESIALSLHIISQADETDLVLPESLTADPPDGLMLAGAISERYIEQLQQLNRPIVLVDFYYPLLELDQIVVDNYDISYEVTTYLIKHGHREIGFMGSLFANSSITDRFYGYLKALQEHDLEYRKEWHLPSLKEGSIHFSNLINPASLPTAFVCHCDRAAYFLSMSLHLHKKNIPEDVSIISFDNTELAGQNHPPLTSVDIDKARFARLALDLLRRRVEHPGARKERVILRGELVIRESVSARA